MTTNTTHLAAHVAGQGSDTGPVADVAHKHDQHNDDADDNNDADDEEGDPIRGGRRGG